MKYTSRDEVDILGRGNGGIVEIRNKIAQYEEPSPLFGFLLYRRRKVLIRYVPEECSRLVQGETIPVHGLLKKGLTECDSSSSCPLQCCDGTFLSPRRSIPYIIIQRTQRLDAVCCLFSAYSFWLDLVVDKFVTEEAVNGD